MYTVPLKSKLPVSSRFSRDESLVSRDESLVSRDESLVSRDESLVSRDASLVWSGNFGINYKQIVSQEADYSPVQK